MGCKVDEEKININETFKCNEDASVIKVRDYISDRFWKVYTFTFIFL